LGYQFTLFRVGLVPGRSALDSDWAAAHLILGHAAVSDLARGEHRFSELLYRESELLGRFADPPGPRIAWVRGPAGTAEAWSLDWNGSGFDLAMADASRGIAYRLSSRPLKPLVLQGPRGVSVKGQTSASLYYSFTRLATEGEVTIDGERFAVTGQSWMDHEISTSALAGEQVGWDWLSLQLHDRREVMLYVLRARDGTVDHAAGTIVAADGEARYIGPADWSLRRSATWQSAESGIEYPAGWELDVPSESLSLRLVPALADQENRSRLSGGPTYWEGAVEIRGPGGALLGRGYVELTGYGGDAGRRPAWP
jgi:predicted secreted hydrolase